MPLLRRKSKRKIVPDTKATSKVVDLDVRREKLLDNCLKSADHPIWRELLDKCEINNQAIITRIMTLAKGQVEEFLSSASAHIPPLYRCGIVTDEILVNNREWSATSDVQDLLTKARARFENRGNEVCDFPPISGKKELKITYVVRNESETMKDVFPAINFQLRGDFEDDLLSSNPSSFSCILKSPLELGTGIIYPAQFKWEQKDGKRFKSNLFIRFLLNKGKAQGSSSLVVSIRRAIADFTEGGCLALGEKPVISPRPGSVSKHPNTAAPPLVRGEDKHKVYPGRLKSKEGSHETTSPRGATAIASKKPYGWGRGRGSGKTPGGGS